LHALAGPLIPAKSATWPTSARFVLAPFSTLHADGCGPEGESVRLYPKLSVFSSSRFLARTQPRRWKLNFFRGGPCFSIFAQQDYFHSADLLFQVWRPGPVGLQRPPLGPPKSRPRGRCPSIRSLRRWACYPVALNQKGRVIVRAIRVSPDYRQYGFDGPTARRRETDTIGPRWAISGAKTILTHGLRGTTRSRSPRTSRAKSANTRQAGLALRHLASVVRGFILP